MRSRYKAFITAGLLVGPLALAQGNPTTPPPARQGASPSQPQAGCPCCEAMMSGGMGGGGAGGHHGMSCPMRGMANVEVEQTPTGAILRLTAKDPGQTAQVQHMAQMMEHCMEGGPQQAPSTQPAPTQQR